MADYAFILPGIAVRVAREELRESTRELAAWRADAVRRRRPCPACNGVGLVHTCRPIQKGGRHAR